MLTRQPLNNTDNILNSIERQFAIRDLDVEFFFKGEQEFYLVQGIEAYAFYGCFRLQQFPGKIVIFLEKTFDSFKGTHWLPPLCAEEKMINDFLDTPHPA